MITYDYQYIDTTHPLYPACVKLRRKKIWKPRNIMLSLQFDAEEKNALFIAALHREKLVGCVMITPEKINDRIIIRQLAVADGYEHRGIGGELVAQAVAHAAFLKFGYTVLYAYADVVPFFEGLGFTPLELQSSDGDTGVWMGRKNYGENEMYF